MSSSPERTRSSASISLPPRNGISSSTCKRPSESSSVRCGDVLPGFRWRISRRQKRRDLDRLVVALRCRPRARNVFNLCAIVRETLRRKRGLERFTSLRRSDVGKAVGRFSHCFGALAVFATANHSAVDRDRKVGGEFGDLGERTARDIGKRRRRRRTFGVRAHGLDRRLGFALDFNHERLDRRGRFVRGFRKPPDLAGDDGKAQAMLTGARRLDRGVEREQLRFVADVFDEFGHAPDLAHQSPEVVHRGGGVGRELGELLHRGQQVLDDFKRVAEIRCGGARRRLRALQMLGGFARG